MNITMIAAMDLNRVIGLNNDIPWRIPRDWQFVKETTMGHAIILGRKNAESIGRALPGRRNIILTRNDQFQLYGFEIVHSVEQVFKRCKDEQEIFIFGGEQVYKLFLPYTDRLLLTIIHDEFDGDTYFPEIDCREWKEISCIEGVKNYNNPFKYCFHEFIRKER